MTSDKIIVLDFGGQYAHLIANRIRRLRVYSEILRPDSSEEAVAGASGMILSGGPASVYDPKRPAFNAKLLGLGLPVLGICYGHQLLCQELGGEVRPGSTREFGIASLDSVRPEGILSGIGDGEVVWMSHGDQVARLPEGFKVLATSGDCLTAAVGDLGRRIYGVQFHPEVTHTRHGMEILDNFLSECGCRREWTMSNYLEMEMSEVVTTVRDRKVFLLVSGGIDSAVVFSLLNRAIGPERVLGLHIDTGMMRKNETELVKQALEKEGFENLIVVDASETFLGALDGVVDPEDKRRAIGRTFIDVKDRALADLDLRPDEWLLGQGTLYPDTIESGGTEHAAVIKTHHNRVEAVQDLISQGMVIEPLRLLYKDEVREVGRLLGLPEDLVERQPFPGPGLAVRLLCSSGSDDAGVEPATEVRVAAISRSFGLDARILPIRSVGVQGDFRTYAHPALLSGEADWDTLEAASTAITNKVREVNRVLYDLGRPGSAAGATVKTGMDAADGGAGCCAALAAKPAFVTRERLDLLREIDSLVTEVMTRHDCMRQISQMPVVLVPVSTDGLAEAVVLRPVDTSDFMTARFARIDPAVAEELAGTVMAVPGVCAVFYDITNKPPGTIEWE